MIAFMVIQIVATFIATIVLTFLISKIFILTSLRYLVVFATVFAILNSGISFIRALINWAPDSSTMSVTGSSSARDILDDMGYDELPLRSEIASVTEGQTRGHDQGCPVIAF